MATVTYTVPNLLNGGAIVGLNIYNSAGELQYNYMFGIGTTYPHGRAAEFQTAGVKTVTWNGQTNWGTTVSTVGCTWKTLCRPDWLRAEFVDFAISTYPKGPEPWMLGQGSHGSLAAVTTTPTQIVTRAGSSENVRNYLVMDLAGTVARYSGWVLSNYPRLYIGGFDIFVIPYGGVQYTVNLGQNLYLYLHEVERTYPSTMNTPKNTTIGEYQDNGTWIGKRVDIMIQGATPALSRERALDRWRYTGNQDVHADGNAGVIAVTYKNQNRVRLYGTNGTDFTRNRSSTDSTQVYDRTELPLLREFFNINSPTGVCVDDLGRAVVVVGGNTLMRFSTNGTTETVLQNQPGMWKLDQNHATKNWYVAYLGTEQRVKRFDANFQNVRTFGKLGGRGIDAIYTKNDFQSLFEIAAHPSGGFLAVEQISPNRLAYFNEEGVHQWEHWGAGGWIPDFQIDPVNPELHWYRSDVWSLMLVHFNYTTKKKTIVGVWQNQGRQQVPFYWDIYNRANMGGFGSWTLKRYKGFTYLCMREKETIMRFDHRTYTMTPVHRMVVGADNNAATFTWTDSNGNGVLDAGEQVSNTHKEYQRWGACASDAHPGNLDWYWFYHNYNNSTGVRTQEIRRRVHRGFNSVGAPLYDPPNQYQVVTNDLRHFDGGRAYYHKAPQMICNDDTHLWIMMVEQPQGGAWGFADKAFINIYSFNRVTGKATYKHRVSKLVDRPRGPDGLLNHVPHPGTNHCFKNCVGVVYNTAVFLDFDGGYDGKYPAPSYCWNGDGFWIGGLFDNPDLSTGRKIDDFHHNGDNGCGNIRPDHRTGEALYAAARENEGALYRIRGWKGWQNQTGTVTQ